MTKAVDSFKQAMIDTESTAFVMWKCNGKDKTKCDFNPGMDAEYLGDQLMKKYKLKDDIIDSCNKYPDCHSCITASEQDNKCGWCMGAYLDYKDKGLTKFKCGGYKEG
jgi:hypothetical protein